MFTGIVEATGEIKSLTVSNTGARICVVSQGLDFGDVKLGDSIATNGICLTVISYEANSYTADVSTETLTRTGFANYQIGQKVNLEKAMLPSTRFGGHIVSGHVDGVGTIEKITPAGNSIEYWINADKDLAPYLAEKGSITVDGVSLTVNSVDGNRFRLTIVPHTCEETIINSYTVGSVVNLEVDVIARYVERLLYCKQQEQTTVKSNITENLLRDSGFIK